MTRRQTRELRRLERALEAAGFEVEAVAIGVGGRPAAIARLGASDDPLRRLVAGARAVLRAVEELALPEGEDVLVSPEEYETLAALRTTLRTLSRVLGVAVPRTVGELAHVDLGRLVNRGEDAEG